MSIRAYRLLRNNQEEGPFTAEEIIQKKLKPYDLIWIDGRSAAWSYPGELAEFKTYAPLPGENQQPNKQNNTATINPSVHAAIAMNKTIAEASLQQKPRYKVSAAWSKIQTLAVPAYKAPMVSEEQKISFKQKAEIKEHANSKSLSWEEAWLDWEKEKTSVPAITTPAKQKPVAVKKKNINESYTAPVLEKKFEQPLDVLKDQYIENILQQKQQSKKKINGVQVSAFVIPAFALLVIFSIAYWLTHGNSETAAAFNIINHKPVISSNNNNAAVQLPDATTNNNNQNNVAVSIAKPLLQDEAADRNPTDNHPAKYTDQKKNIATVAALNNDATKNAVDETKKQFDSSAINNIADNNASINSNDLNNSESRPVRRRTYDIDENTTAPNQNSVTANKPAVKKTVADYVSTPEYISMTDGSANLKIQNISDVNLDLVVVDVQYYDASHNYRKGETLYLHNLKAGKDVIIKTSKDSNSYFATSKVSMVSSDASNVNVIGDH